MFKCKGTLIRQLYIGFTEKTSVIQTFFLLSVHVQYQRKDTWTIKLEWNFFCIL